MFFKLFTRSPSLLWSSHSQFFNLVQLNLISKRKFLLEIITYLLPLWWIKAHPLVFSSQGKVPEKRFMNFKSTILGRILQSWWLASHGFAVLDGKLYSRSASIVETMDILFMSCRCFFCSGSASVYLAATRHGPEVDMISRSRLAKTEKAKTATHHA